MSTVVEDVVARFRWVTNREELRAAKRSTDELAQATEKLDEEVAQSARAQADLRRELVALRKERAEGKGDAKAIRQREAEVRGALMEQADAARQAKIALSALKKEQREAAKAAGDLARQEEAAAKKLAAAAGKRLAASRAAAIAAHRKQAAEDAARAKERDFTGGLGRSARERFKAATSPDAALDGASSALGGASSLARTGLAAAGGGLLAGGLGLGVGAASVGMEFESLRTALATTTGSAASAEEAFNKIRAFAKATPYDVAQVTEAFIKLKNRGLDASEPALRSYGDTAAAMGKTLDDMVEAVADATVGEFERLKEFGVKASVQGNKVKLTFRGVTTEVGKNAGEIERYLVRLGEQNFAGGMEAQSKTLAGVLGALGDSVKMFLDEIFRGEFGTALKEVAADLGLFADSANGAAPAISEVLAGAVRGLWAALQRVLGDPADLGERIEGWAASVGDFLTSAGKFVDFFVFLAEKVGGANVAIGLVGLAVLGLVGPFGAALAAGTALGVWLGSTFPGVADGFVRSIQNIEQAARDLGETGDALRTVKDGLYEMARGADAGAASFARMMLKITGTADELSRLEQIERGRREEEKKREEAAARGKAVDKGRAARDERDQAAAKAHSKAMAERGPAAVRAKMERYRALGKKKRLTPHEQKELQVLRQELDLPTPTRPGKDKPDSKWEADREAEIKKLRQQAETRAGARALMEGKSGAEQNAAAKAAGERVEKNLRERVRAGGALPGELNVSLLKGAGFEDVAGSATPPPVAVTIVKVPEFDVAVTFTGAISDVRAIRDEIERVVGRVLPEHLADGMRNIRWPTVY